MGIAERGETPCGLSGALRREAGQWKACIYFLPHPKELWVVAGIMSSFSWRDTNRYLVTLDRAPTADQRNTEKHVYLSWVSQYMYGGYLQEQGWTSVMEPTWLRDSHVTTTAHQKSPSGQFLQSLLWSSTRSPPPGNHLPLPPLLPSQRQPSRVL